MCMIMSVSCLHSLSHLYSIPYQARYMSVNIADCRSLGLIDEPQQIITRIAWVSSPLVQAAICKF